MIKTVFMGLLGGMFASASFAASVTARFNPCEIAQGQYSTYDLIVEGDTSVPVGDIPSPAGLDLTYLGKQTSYQAGTAGTFSRVIFSYTARAQKPGEYTVGGYNVRIGNATYAVPPCTLTVVDIPQGMYYSAPYSGSPYQQPSSALAPNAPSVTFECTPPLGKVYVGQSILLSAQLRVREEVVAQAADQAPKLIGEAFTLQQSSEKPALSTAKGYRQITFQQKLTPLKAGEFPLQLSFPVLVEIPSNQWNGQLSAGMMAMLTGMMGISEPILMKTEPYNLVVSDLPANQPADFCGGIGNLTPAVALFSKTCEVGEPVQLTLTLTGSGNFDRIVSPRLESSADWKVYSPTVKFTPSDALGIQGSKQITYLISPRHTGVTKAPTLSFSFFDPKKGNYISYTSEPLEVSVKPSSPTEGSAAASSTAVATSVPSPQAVLSEGTPSSWQSPIPWKGLLKGILYTLGALALILSAIIIYRRRVASAQFKRSQLIEKHLHALSRAAQKGDAPLFFDTTKSLVAGLVAEGRDSLTWQELILKAYEADWAAGLIETLQAIATLSEAKRFGHHELGEQRLGVLYEDIRAHLIHYK